jgi:hypothetical protein
MPRLPLIDWDSLRNKPPLILRDITKFAAFALLSAETYSSDIAAGSKGGSINMPGALFHLGPDLEFSPEMLSPFRSWIVSCAFRESVELILRHLDDIRNILAVCSLPADEGADSPTWQNKVVDEGRQFHRRFLKRKVDHLKEAYAYTPSDDLKLFVTIMHARNCLVHRDGIVFEEDTNEPDALVVRWPAQDVTLSNPDEPSQIIRQPGGALRLGGSFELRAAMRAKAFSEGKRIDFTTQELNEIGAFLSGFTIDLAFRAQKRARELVGLLERSWNRLLVLPTALFVRLTSLTLSCAAKGRAATRIAARWLLPCVLASALVRFAANVTPNELCSAQAARPPGRSRAATASAWS